MAIKPKSLTRVKSPRQFSLFGETASIEAFQSEKSLVEIVSALQAILANWDELFRLEILNDRDPNRAFKIHDFSWKHLKPLFPIVAPEHPFTNATLVDAAWEVQKRAMLAIRFAAEMPVEAWS
jgi:hypothetical protein